MIKVQKNQVITRLLELPDLMAAAERKVFEAHNELLAAKETLLDEEADCILSERVEGKNQAARDAQLRDLTKEERFVVSQADQVYKESQIEANRLRNEFTAMNSITKLLLEQQ